MPGPASWTETQRKYLDRHRAQQEEENAQKARAEEKKEITRLTRVVNRRVAKKQAEKNSALALSRKSASRVQAAGSYRPLPTLLSLTGKKGRKNLSWNDAELAIVKEAWKRVPLDRLRAIYRQQGGSPGAWYSPH